MKRFANVDKTDREIKIHEFFKESEIQVLQNSAFDFAGYLQLDRRIISFIKPKLVLFFRFRIFVVRQIIKKGYASIMV
jgi:hypothetical protein